MTTEERIGRVIIVFFTLILTMLITLIIIMFVNIYTPNTMVECGGKKYSFQEAKDN